MENVWDKLKILKGRSWADAKDILNNVPKDVHAKEILQTYLVNCETLPEEDRDIYGTYPKTDPFYLERCKLCSLLVKESIIDRHYDLHHKRCSNNNVKKSSFVSPNKKKFNSRKGNKSTSEDDSESIISSETPSPAIDLVENQSSDSNTGTTREDSIVDTISVEEVPSGESKPPTPGPQDFYDDFAVPYPDETQALSTNADAIENGRSIYTSSKPSLKLKITSAKDANVKFQSTTSLLEAHLLSNTSYNTVVETTAMAKHRNSNHKFGSSLSIVKKEGQQHGGGTVIIDQNSKIVEVVDQMDPLWKTALNQSLNVAAVAPKLRKDDTKISIPISVLPQNVKIINTLNKTNATTTTAGIVGGGKVIFKTIGQKSSLLGGESTDHPGFQYSSQDADAMDSGIELKEKTSKSKRSKKSKGKNRTNKCVEFDPDRHCGVLLDENRRCMRSLTCKTHAIALRRAVEGRSKEFDKLLADHRASKEALKEQERNQSYGLNEPTINIPMLNVDKITGRTMELPSANNDSEMIKIRVPNTMVNKKSDNRHNATFEPLLNHNQLIKTENDNVLRKIPSNLYTVKGTNQTPLNGISSDGDAKPQIYENDVKISFVCSDMLYKVGGLLYTDRSRQAIRKCMEPLISPSERYKTTTANTGANAQPNRSLATRKMTDFLQLVKNNHQTQPVRLSLFKDDLATEKNGILSAASTVERENVAEFRNALKVKANEEMERMKNVLANSCKLLGTLAADENAAQKLCISRRLKRKADRGKFVVVSGVKKIKQESMADENYDINSLLSFNKTLQNVKTNDESVSHFQTISTGMDGFALQNLNETSQQRADTMDNVSYDVYLNQDNGNAYVGNDTEQLLQTFKDLETEIRKTVGSNMQEVYVTPAQQQPMANNANALYNNYTMNANANMGYKENCETLDGNITNLEETISKDYSLLEEYCKNIANDELFLEGAVRNVAQGNPSTTVPTNAAVEGLSSFDTQLLNSYLSSISTAADANNQNINEMAFVNDGRRYNVIQVDGQEQGTSADGQIYGDMLTFNKQFTDNTAVKLEKPPTPNPVYTETENEEVLKWLF